MLCLKIEIEGRVERESCRCSVIKFALDVAGKCKERFTFLVAIYDIVFAVKHLFGKGAPLSSISRANWVVSKADDEL